MNNRTEHIVEGNIVDVLNRRIFSGRITIRDKKIASIDEKRNISNHYIMPGLIDAHVHIESSMLTPGRFAEMAIRNGTVAVVSDPHEIANVLGTEGVRFMMDDGETVPLKFYFGAPSCVPATPFESSGARIGTNEIKELLMNENIHFLSEMMDFPGVIKGDKEVMEKIKLAQKAGKKIDGHAPGLSGKELNRYAKAGITTDHECTTLKEAEEKLKLGMKILIREGSAAKDFNELYPLIDKFPEEVMLCTDDIHPDDLVQGHINNLVKKGLRNGLDLFNLLYAACITPQKHYNLKVGSLKMGDPADMIIVNNLNSFEIVQTIIDGKPAFQKNSIMFKYSNKTTPNTFYPNIIKKDELVVPAKNEKINIIEAIDHQLLTKRIIKKQKIKNNFLSTDSENDVLKIVVLNRYEKSKPTIGFIKGFGLKRGAIASSIAHDSHNIIAVGVTDDCLAEAINTINKHKGGIVVVDKNRKEFLDLPIAGIISNDNGKWVAEKYKKLNAITHQMGSKLTAPFMTLSFMALLVIPEIKIGDKGLFDVHSFTPIQLYESENM